MNTFSKTDDIIDSGDVVARIEELESDLAAFNEDTDASHYWDDDLQTELDVLKALAAEGEGCGDWGNGELMIRDSYFQDYAQQLAEDCAMLPKNLTWPCNCIDWEHAAKELKYDYSGIDFDGVTYWVHS